MFLFFVSFPKMRLKQIFMKFHYKTKDIIFYISYSWTLIIKSPKPSLCKSHDIYTIPWPLRVNSTTATSQKKNDHKNHRIYVSTMWINKTLFYAGKTTKFSRLWTRNQINVWSDLPGSIQRWKILSSIFSIVPSVTVISFLSLTSVNSFHSAIFRRGWVSKKFFDRIFPETFK